MSPGHWRTAAVPPRTFCRNCGRGHRSWTPGALCGQCRLDDPLALVRADPFRPRQSQSGGERG